MTDSLAAQHIRANSKQIVEAFKQGEADICIVESCSNLLAACYGVRYAKGHVEESYVLLNSAQLYIDEAANMLRANYINPKGEVNLAKAVVELFTFAGRHGIDIATEINKLLKN